MTNSISTCRLAMTFNLQFLLIRLDRRVLGDDRFVACWSVRLLRRMGLVHGQGGSFYLNYKGSEYQYLPYFLFHYLQLILGWRLKIYIGDKRANSSKTTTHILGSMKISAVSFSKSAGNSQRTPDSFQLLCTTNLLCSSTLTHFAQLHE